MKLKQRLTQSLGFISSWNHSKLRLIKFSVIIGVGVLIYKILPFLVYLGLYGYVGSNIDKSIHSSKEYSSITLGTYQLSIPKSYLYYEDQLTGGDFTSTNMYALLPDISPRTSQNNSQVDFSFFPRGGNVITMDLGVFTHSIKVNAELLASKLKSNAIDPNDSGEASEFGLTKYRTKSSAIFNDIFSYRYQNGDYFILACTRYDPESVRNPRSPPASTCKRNNVYIANRLYLNYEYSRSHLKSWREIDRAVKNFTLSLILEKIMNDTYQLDAITIAHVTELKAQGRYAEAYQAR